MIDHSNLAVSYNTYRLFVRNSAKTLSESLDFEHKLFGDIFGHMPFYYLASHASELFLKDALLKRGFSEGDLRKLKYRYDLSALLAELVSKGVPVTDTTRTMIERLGAQHKTHELRFPDFVKGINVFLPEPSSVFEMLDELFSLTRISTHGA